MGSYGIYKEMTKKYDKAQHFPSCPVIVMQSVFRPAAKSLLIGRQIKSHVHLYFAGNINNTVYIKCLDV